MKSLVVYYSRTGTTKKVGQAVAKALKADVEEIIDTKDRAGAIGYILAGTDATLKKLTVIKEMKKNPKGYGLVVIGTPIWSWTVTPPVRTYLSQYKGLKKVAFFCTEGGSGGPRAFKEMETICGKKPIATLELTTREVIKDKYQDKLKAFVDKLKKVRNY